MKTHPKNQKDGCSPRQLSNPTNSRLGAAEACAALQAQAKTHAQREGPDPESVAPRRQVLVCSAGRFVSNTRRKKGFVWFTCCFSLGVSGCVLFLGTTPLNQEWWVCLWLPFQTQSKNGTSIWTAGFKLLFPFTMAYPFLTRKQVSNESQSGVPPPFQGEELHFPFRNLKRRSLWEPLNCKSLTWRNPVTPVLGLALSGNQKDGEPIGCSERNPDIHFLGPILPHGTRDVGPPLWFLKLFQKETTYCGHRQHSHATNQSA